jgi:hypothetical protein
MISNALNIWEKKLKRPKRNELFAIERLNDSNVFLIKDYENRIGLIIENTLQVKSTLEFKKIDIVFFEKLYNPKSKKFHLNCLLFLFEKNVNHEFLIRILVGLMEKSLSGKMTSKEFLEILRKVSETFDLVSSNTQEVIGVWGELYFINKLIQDANHNLLVQSRIIKSWESVLGRKKIDFRFDTAKTAFEIKTTTKDERIHHISGLDQIRLPLGYKEAYIVSFRIIEDENLGQSCHDLYKKIRDSLFNKELQLEFDERVLIRGSFVCKDKNLKFRSRDILSDNFYPFKKIPKPVLSKAILSVEWNVDFDKISCLGKSRSGIVLKKLLSSTD